MTRHTEVVSLIAKVLNVRPSRIGPDASMETVPEWDSLAHLSICLAVQEQYRVELDMETIAQVTSLRKIEDFIAKAV